MDFNVTLCHGERSESISLIPRCTAKRCFTEHALERSEGFSMTWVSWPTVEFL